jgi:mono/diheme cytochrome c family protein
MKNSRMLNRMGYLLMVSSVMAMFILHIGISTSFADDLVKKAQQTLVDKGIDPGPVDGFWGPKTKNGVMEFQKNEGLAVSGRLDDATKNRLFATAESPPSNIEIAKEPVVQEEPKAPVVPAMKEKEEPKAKEPVKQMAETPQPVAPPKVAMEKKPEPKKEVLSSAVKPSGPCPQKRKTKSAPSNIAKMDKTGSASLENGKKIYAKTAKPMACKQCHGDQGNGLGKLGAVLKPNPRNFTCNETMKNVSVGQMFWIIKNGSAGSGMVAHKKTLKDSEIWDVVKYIRSTFMADASSAKATSSSAEVAKSAAVVVPEKPKQVAPSVPAKKPEVTQSASSTLKAQMVVGKLPKGVAGKVKYEENAVSGGGSISGVIHFKGNAPATIMEDLNKGKNVEFCATHPDTGEGNIRPRVKVMVTEGKLKDTVVFIQNITKGKAWPTEVTNFDFKTCDVFPKVSVVRKTPKGMKTGLLTITNLDEEILHNPHGYSVAGANRKTLFNKPLPSKGDVADVTKTFKRFKVKKDKHFFLQCDQHNFMEADARVVWNPYYSVSGADGVFKIDQIPAGKYWVTAWHPYLGEVSQEVTVAGGADAKADFELLGG